jgi:fluoroquinolone transport system ATP-binding protein
MQTPVNPAMLNIEELSFTYPGNDLPTLRQLSFSLGQGEILGFLGPSGSGKSTTQKILYKLLNGYGGKVTFDGKPLFSWGLDFYERIGVSFELPNHYLKLTAHENLRFFASFYRNQATETRISQLLEMVGLLPDANKRVSDYSKGMKMRLNFIRSLLHDPEVLYLDEPTSGLDPINANIIKETIRDLKKAGKTIFLTTHNMFDADQLCDRVALVHEGEIKALDTPEVLKLRYGQARVNVTLRAGGEKSYALDALGEDPEFLSLLKQKAVQTIHSQEASLEEVFIKITGRSLQ